MNDLNIIENNSDEVKIALYEFLNALLVRLQDIQNKIKKCL